MCRRSDGGGKINVNAKTGCDLDSMFVTAKETIVIKAI